MKINSVQIAKIAGVSRSTVSRVINNYSNVPDETREKVMKVVEEMNYVPNSSARALAGKSKERIGLFIYEEHHDKDKILDGGITFGYYLDFINRVLKEALKHDYQLLVDIVERKTLQRKVDRLFGDRSISGAIFLGFKKDDSILKNIINRDYPICLIDYSNKKLKTKKNITYINTSDYLGARKAVSYLIKLGCKRIIHITGDTKKLSGIERERGYIDELKKMDLEYIKTIKGEYQEEKAYESMMKILKKGEEFDGVFAGNDNMAYGVKRALDEIGKKDIQLMGFDNLRNTMPMGIMSVSPKVYQVAKQVIKALVENQENENILTVDTVLIKTLSDYIENSKLEY